jgi:putative GTP pyrophosphokinase
VASRFRGESRLTLVGRCPKTVSSIVGKVRRERIRLSQIQDIAGLRTVVGGCDEQDRIVQKTEKCFTSLRVIDRRQRPSHGYRAVHVVVTVQDRPVEVQIRTALQHQWAELSEKFSDRFPGLKYGELQVSSYYALLRLSEAIAIRETSEQELRELRHSEVPVDRDQLVRWRERLVDEGTRMQRHLDEALERSIASFKTFIGER